MLDLNLNLNLGLASVFGDPTALTQSNADSLFTALGLTQAGTGTTWGETGNDETPLYSVAAAKVPLAVEEINGKKYFGPIVNPAGTNLALRDRNATNAAWTKTATMTAALALGGLEHGPTWRGQDLNGTEELGTFAGSLPIVDGDGYIITRTGSGTINNYLDITVPSHQPFIYLKLLVEDDDIASGINLGIGNNNSVPVISFTTAGEHEFIYRFTTKLRLFANNGSSQKVTILEVAEVDAHSILTATADNATCLQSITSTSGERVTKWWTQTEDEDVFVSHGTPTGTRPYDDDYSSDTSGEWSRGFDSVDGSIGVTGGKLTYTEGAGDGPFPRIYRAVSVTVGKLYKITRGALSGTATGGCSARVYSASGGTGSILFGGATLFALPATAIEGYWLATQATVYLTLVMGGASSETAELDEYIIDEVSETELTPGANPTPVDLAAATFANPQLGIRIANSGDSVRLYGTQHQVAARPLRPYIGPTVGSTVTSGARSLTRTGFSGLTSIDIEIAFKVEDGDLRFCIDCSGGMGLYIANATRIVWWRLPTNKDHPLITAALNQLVLIRLVWTGTTAEYAVNNGELTAHTNQDGANVSAITSIRIGDRSGGSAQSETPILAFRDNIGNLLDGNLGWNHRLLDNWT